MNTPSSSSRARNWAFDSRRTRDDSHIILTIFEGLMGLGIVSALCATAGFFDDVGDSVVLGVTGALFIGIGAALRAKLIRRRRPTAAAVLSGLAATWLALVVVGTAVYLVTGTINRIDDALVESAAGFSTTALTTLDPSELSVPMALWRASTQWLGGLVGILIGVVAADGVAGAAHCAKWGGATTSRPQQTRTSDVKFWWSTLVSPQSSRSPLPRRAWAPNTRRTCLTTISTGGFSSVPDSLRKLRSRPSGCGHRRHDNGAAGLRAIWWAIRQQVGPNRSCGAPSFVCYGVNTAVGDASGLVGSRRAVVERLTVHNCILGQHYRFAVTDWTSLDDAVTALLLVIIATGSMIGSAGGGLSISRARILVAFARRELRRQLDPAAVVVLKSSGRAVDDRAVERITGHQIAHLATCATAAGFLALAGVDLVGAIYTGVSVLSTHGPGIGVGPFGDLSNFSQPARLLLVPFMLAGRLSLVPLMIGIVWIVHAQQGVRRELRASLGGWPARLTPSSLLERRRR